MVILLSLAILLLSVAFGSILALRAPRILVYTVFVAAALTGPLQALDDRLGVALPFSLPTLPWLYLGLACGLMWSWRGAWSNYAAHHVLYALFLLFALTRLAVEPSAAGARHLMFYAVPFAVLLFTSAFLDRERDAISVTRVLAACVLLLVLLYGTLVPLGLIRVTSVGPWGLFGPRPVALFALVCLACGFAGELYPTGPRERAWLRVIVVLTLALILFTLSRTALAAAVFLLVVRFLKPLSIRRIFASVVTTAGVWVGMVFAAPTVFLRGDPTTLHTGGFEFSSSVDWSGRLLVWPVLLERVAERPLVGWGLGSSREVAGAELGRSTGFYPHNEMIQIAHDLGIFGSMLLWGVWFLAMVHLWWRWRREERVGNDGSARIHFAALLGCLVILLTSLTDNTLHYMWVTSPALALIGVAHANGSDELVGDA